MRVVSALIHKNKDILMALRKMNARCPGMWELPGGKVEQGESERAALSRECNEELGVDAIVGQKIAAHTFEFPNEFVDISLYSVILMGIPRPLSSLAIIWTPLATAVETMTLTPSTYVWAGEIERFINA